MNRRGRPRASAPPGRVTLEQAAQLSGLSYKAVQRRVAAGDVPSVRDPSGVITIAEADVSLLQPRAPAGDPRKGITLRVLLAEHDTFLRAARKAGHKTVSAWLLALARKSVTTGDP